MSHYVRCLYCGEDGRDVDTGVCGCAEEKAAEAQVKAHAEAVEAVVEAGERLSGMIGRDTCGWHRSDCACQFCTARREWKDALDALAAARRG